MALNFPNNPTTNDTYTLNDVTWTWDGTTWNLVGSLAQAGDVSIPSDVNELSDVDNLIPDDINDLTDTTNLIPSVLTDLSIVDGTDGQVLTTNGQGTFTFATVEGGEGGGTLQNVFATVNGDSGSTTADNSADTLTIQGGTNISTSVFGDTLSINFSGSVAEESSQLVDFQTAGLTIDKIYEPAYVMLRVDNNGTTAYTFNSHYSGDNPSIYLISGMTVAFDLDGISGHPFEIQDSEGNAFNTGLVHVTSAGVVSTGADAQGKTSGTLYWRIPETTASPPNFRYQCQVHVAMVGAIVIKDLSTL